MVALVAELARQQVQLQQLEPSHVVAYHRAEVHDADGQVEHLGDLVQPRDHQPERAAPNIHAHLVLVLMMDQPENATVRDHSVHPQRPGPLLDHLPDHLFYDTDRVEIRHSALEAPRIFALLCRDYLR